MNSQLWPQFRLTKNPPPFTAVNRTFGVCGSTVMNSVSPPYGPPVDQQLMPAPAHAVASRTAARIADTRVMGTSGSPKS